jgi:Cu-Zn family superoxide dismutase
MVKTYNFLSIDYMVKNTINKKKAQKSKKNKTSKTSTSSSTRNLKAIAVLAENPDKVTGTINFIQKGKNLEIKYDIKGLTDGDHGFHIHEYGNLLDGCTTAGGHFNPHNKNHGGLTSKERHAGDLGNIKSLSGQSSGTITTDTLSLLNNKVGIIGRMVVVHADPDDLGRGGDKESLITGNAGRRVACGVIGKTK